ncbi:MAG: zinc-binding dehydrogenase [Draconibacterium sp.]
MKANVIIKNGKAEEVFKIIELPKPSLKEDEVLVKVHYTSVNPLDCRIRTIPNSRRTFPVTLGFDLYGEIIEAGNEVEDLLAGDKIIASPNPFFAGANAEYISVKANMCLKVADLDPKIGAAIPLVGITAYEALFDKLKIGKNDSILIHAGAGGVGHIAIQLAKNKGCRVITTASKPESIHFCRETLKADYVINYKTEDFVDSINQLTNQQGIGFILDTVGGDTFIESLTCLKAGGHICTILPVYFDELVGYNNLLKSQTISYEYMGISGLSGRHKTILNELVAQIVQNKLLPHIYKEFQFDEIAQAHDEIEKGHTIGKIIVKVDE